MSSKKDDPDYKDEAGFQVFEDGDVQIWDDFADNVHLTEKQVFQLFQRLQKEYEPGEEDKNSFTPFYVQNRYHRYADEETGECEDCGGEVNIGD